MLKSTTSGVLITRTVVAKLQLIGSAGSYDSVALD